MFDRLNPIHRRDFEPMASVLRSKRSHVQIVPGVFLKTYGLLSLENGVVDNCQLELPWRVQFYPAVSRHG